MRGASNCANDLSILLNEIVLSISFLTLVYCLPLFALDVNSYSYYNKVSYENVRKTIPALPISTTVSSETKLAYPLKQHGMGLLL
jgi:hypothetical protein